MSSAAPTGPAQRRSTRIRLEMPIVVTSLDPDRSFSEHCRTLVVNPQGCGLQFPYALEVGTLVRLQGLPGDPLVTARVANCLAIGADGKFWLIGVALDEPGNVWGVANPPADWQVAKAAAAGAAADPSKKSREWPYSQFSNRGEFHPGRR